MPPSCRCPPAGSSFKLHSDQPFWKQTDDELAQTVFTLNWNVASCLFGTCQSFHLQFSWNLPSFPGNKLYHFWEVALMQTNTNVLMTGTFHTQQTSPALINSGWSFFARQKYFVVSNYIKTTFLEETLSGQYIRVLLWGIDIWMLSCSEWLLAQ